MVGSIDGFASQLGALPTTEQVETVAQLGKPYVVAPTDLELPEPERSDFDPDVAGRGVNAHGKLQNAVAEYLESKSIEPLSPEGIGFKWDIAWEDGSEVFVGEVKSLTARNEEGHSGRVWAKFFGTGNSPAGFSRRSTRC